MDFKAGSARYAFGRFVLDLGHGVLLEDGEERALRPKSFSLSRHMVENADRLINRDEIMQVVVAGYICNRGQHHAMHRGNPSRPQ